MSYTTGCHTIFHHRYHIVWVPKYRYKVVRGKIRERIRTIVRQVCKEMGVTIVSGVLSTDHVHIFVEIPPHVAVSYFMQKVKGRTSRKIQQEFQFCVNAIGDNASGPEATSVQQVVILLMKSYSNIWRNTRMMINDFQSKKNLPAPAGSRSVKNRMYFLTPSQLFNKNNSGRYFNSVWRSLGPYKRKFFLLRK